MSVYLGQLRDGTNLLDGDYILNQEMEGLAGSVNFKKVERGSIKLFNNITFAPADLPYLLASLTGKNNFQLLRKLRPAHFSFFVPKIRLYKVYQGNTSGKTAEIPIVFPNVTTDEDMKGANPEYFFLSGAGIKSFDAKFQGVNEAEVENNIRCKLKLFFTSLNELGKEHTIVDGQLRQTLEEILQENFIDSGEDLDEYETTPSTSAGEEAVPAPQTFLNYQEMKRSFLYWRYLDLITPPLPASIAREDGKRRYFSSDYRIRVDFGWSVDVEALVASAMGGYGSAVMSVAEVAQIKKIVERLNYSLYLNLMTHTFNLSQEGTVEVEAEFIGTAEELVNNPDCNVFFGSFKDQSGEDGFVGAHQLRRKEARLDNLRVKAKRERDEVGAGGDSPAEDELKEQELDFKQREAAFLKDALPNFIKTVRNVGAGGFLEISDGIIGSLHAPTPQSSRFGGSARIEIDEADGAVAVGPGKIPMPTDKLKAAKLGFKIIKENLLEAFANKTNRTSVGGATGVALKTLAFSTRILDGPLGDNLQDGELPRQHLVAALRDMAGMEGALDAPTETDRLRDTRAAANITVDEIPGGTTGALSAKVSVQSLLIVGAKNASDGMAALDALAKTDASLAAEIASDATQDEMRASLEKARESLGKGVVKFIVGHKAVDVRIKDINEAFATLAVKPVTFLTIGDILNAVLLGMPAAFRTEVRVLLGTINLVRTPAMLPRPEVFYIPIADIPITYRNFFTWFVKNIVATEGYDYTIGEFLSRGLRQLISIALGKLSLLEFRSFSPFSVGHFHFTLPSTIANQTFGLTWPVPDATTAPGDNYIDLSRFERATGPDVLTADVGRETKQTQVLLVTGKAPVEGLLLSGDVQADEKKGIKHFFIGADSDILIQATLDKDNLPGFRESKISQATEEGISSQFTLLSEPYLLTLRLIGNACFYPGMRVYFHPSVLGLKGRSEIRNIMEGYYLIYEVTQMIESGKYETELKCRYEMGPATFRGRKNPEFIRFEAERFYDPLND